MIRVKAMNSNNQDLKNITKESITQALLRLMQEKEYKDISITDVCKLAGVSRNAFYRNYPAKDAILRQYMYEFTDVWRRQLRTVKNLTAKQYFTTLFIETGKHKELIRMLHKAQIEYLLIDVIFTFFRNFTLHTSQIHYLQCHFAGSIHSIIVHWIMNEQPETPEELGLMVCNFNHLSPNTRINLPEPIPIEKLMTISTFTYRN